MLPSGMPSISMWMASFFIPRSSYVPDPPPTIPAVTPIGYAGNGHPQAPGMPSGLLCKHRYIPLPHPWEGGIHALQRHNRIADTSRSPH